MAKMTQQDRQWWSAMRKHLETLGALKHGWGLPAKPCRCKVCRSKGVQ